MRSWTNCGEARAETFGIDALTGWGFTQGNVVRDLLALQRVEVLPWDTGWGLLEGGDVRRDATGHADAQADAVDELARCSASSGAEALHALRHDGVRLPAGWDFGRAPTLAQLRASPPQRRTE